VTAPTLTGSESGPNLLKLAWAASAYLIRHRDSRIRLFKLAFGNIFLLPYYHGCYEWAPDSTGLHQTAVFATSTFTLALLLKKVPYMTRKAPPWCKILGQVNTAKYLWRH